MANINGTSGADVLNGFASNDFIRGFGASDTISGLGGNDRVFGGGGADLLRGSFGDDLLAGDAGDDTLRGNRGNDGLFGNSKNDLLRGGGGEDTLHGGTGDDILRGGFDNDTLIGGAGRDRFLIGSAQGTDTILDFEDGIDKIRLLQGNRLDGLTLSDLKIRRAGKSTHIFLDKPGNRWDGSLMAIVNNIAPNQITADDIYTPNTAPIAQDDTLSGLENALIMGDVLADNGSGIDSDPEGNPLAIASVNGSSSAVGTPTAIASGAIVTLNFNGTFTYDPNGAFDSLMSGANGTDTFTYTLGDGRGGLDTATVTLSLTGINNSPIIGTNTGASVGEGNSVVLSNTQLNEADPDDSGSGSFYSITGATTHGRVELTTNPGNSINGFTQADLDNNLVRYVHNGSETNMDSFTFALSDGGEDGATTETGTFTFTINPVNDPPVAVDDAFATDQDNLIISGLFDANPTTADSDPDDASFTVTEVDGNSANVGSLIDLASGAQLTVNSSGSFNYTPNGAFDTLPGGASDTETFTYQIGDGNGGFDTATATITIFGVNDAPDAVDDSESTLEDNSVVISVLGNDSDIDDGDTLTVNSFTNPSNGMLVNNGSGSFTYTPNLNFNGNDSFTYTITDGNGGFDTATVNINITPINDPPTAVDDAFGTDQDTTLNDDLFAANPTTADSDPEGATLTVTQVNGVAANVDSAIALASGAQLTVNNDGTFSYDPNGQFDTLAGGVTTTDSFTYQIGDSSGGFDTATATVTVTGLNEAPVAVDDAFTTNEDTALSSGNVLSSNPTTADSDIDDGDTLTVTQVNGSSGNVGSLITLPSGAQLTMNANGTFTYDPNGAFEDITTTTTDSFTYQIGDGNGGLDTATATITITPVNDAPVNTVPGAQTTNSVTPITFTTISISDVDAGSETLETTVSITSGTPSAFGTLTVASGSGASVTGDGTDTVTIEGTLAQINAALNGLVYDPAGTIGSVELTLSTSDQGNTASGGTQTDSDTIDVTVNSPNATPVVDLDGSLAGVNFSTSFTEDGGAIDIADTDSTITDADVGDSIERLTITLTNAQTGDSLSINGGSGALPAGISLDGASTSSTIILTGAATPADYTTALQLIQFNNTSDNPSTTNRTVTVVANDGDVDNATATTTISVTAVNDPATISAPSYTGNANLTLTVADGAGDLLDGATDPEGTTVSVVATTVTSAAAQATATTTDDNNVTINTDGSFTYEAVAGFVGNDTFVYQLQDSGLPLPTAATNVTATITLNDLDGNATVPSALLWFIDEDAVGTSANLGTQANPFTSLAAFNSANTGAATANPEAGDFIFIDEDSTNSNNDGLGVYAGGITLLNNQTLIGDGSTSNLATLTGMTLGSFNALDAFSGNQPTLSNSSGNGITLASGNTIRGLDVGDSSGMGIRGTSVGTLTISDVSINNNTGGGFEVTTGGDVSNVALTGVTTGGGDHGISLTNTTGNVTFSNVNINGTTGSAVELNNVAGNVTVNGAIGATTDAGNAASAAVDINGGTAAVNIGAAITNSVGEAVEVTGRSGSTVTFSGNINHSASGAIGIDVGSNTGGTTTFNAGTKTINSGTATAVNLTSNRGHTINFTNGGLDIDTTSGIGYNATGGGNLSVTGTNNTVTSTTGTAVNIANTFISGANGITFRSISSNGGTNGVVLNRTGGGAFTVTGDGSTAGSGGLIQNKTDRGFDIQNASNVSLNFIQFNNAGSTNGADPLNAFSGAGDPATGTNLDAHAAVHLNRVTNAVLNNLDIDNGAQNGINANNTTNLTISNTTIDGVGNQQREAGLNLFGVDGTLTISNSNIDGGGPERAALIANYGSEVLTLNVSDSTFRDTQDTGIGADGLELRVYGTGSADINVTNSFFLRNRTNGIQLIVGDTAFARIDITGSTFDPSTGVGIGINLGVEDNATLNFNIINNARIHSRGGSAVAGGAFDNGILEGRVNNNSDIQVLSGSGNGIGFVTDGSAGSSPRAIVEIDGNTIDGITNDYGIDLAARRGRLDATVNNNDINILNSATGGLFIEGRNPGVELRANITNNDVDEVGSVFGPYAYLLGESSSGSVILDGFATDTTTTLNNNGNTLGGGLIPNSAVITDGSPGAGGAAEAVDISLP